MIKKGSKNENNYYLDEPRFKKILDEKDDVIQRLSRLIEKFQKDDEERQKRPRNRMHVVRSRESKYGKIILTLLKKAGKGGLTVKEIIKNIKNAFKFFYFITFDIFK